jgi:hypothetical protein
MRIVEFFRDWIANNEEKIKFREAWIKEKVGRFGWDDKVDAYHSDIAYEIYQLTKRIEELEQKIK